MSYQPPASPADDQAPELWTLRALPSGLLAEVSARLDKELLERREAERGLPSSHYTDALQDQASAARILLRTAMRRRPSGGAHDVPRPA